MQKNMWQAFCGKYVKVGSILRLKIFLAERLYSWHTIRKCSVPWFLKQIGQISGGTWVEYGGMRSDMKKKGMVLFSDRSAGHVPFPGRLYQQIREEGTGI